MRVVTAEQMRERDRWAMEKVGLPGMVLMENAGRQVAALAARLLGSPGGRKVWVFAGKGNNGGDGLVAARHLAKAGAVVEVFLLAPEEELVGDAAANLKIYRQLGLPLTEITTGTELAHLVGRLKDVELLIDAMLGTGTRGPVRGLLAAAITFLNNSGRRVLAVDLPSGLNADTGACPGPVVKAQDTISLDLPKQGLILFPGAQQVGRLWVAEMGIPRGAPMPSPGTFFTTPQEILPFLSPRPRESHKGTWGRVLVVAGSRGMAGAALLTGRGALRAGAGLVTVASPAEVQPQVASQLVEAMTYPLPQGDQGTLSREAGKVIQELLAPCDVLALGPGLGQGEGTGAVARELLPRVEVPVVLDADGLNALAGDSRLLAKIPGPVVITPHPGEMARLCGLTTAEVQADRLELARRKAGEWGVTLVLKGARTVIAQPDGRVAINSTGNPGLATGGTGDVLTGIIAGLLAQGFTPFAAAVTAAFLHGAAADLGVEEKGEEGLLATDVLEFLPAARKALAEGKELLPFFKFLP